MVFAWLLEGCEELIRWSSREEQGKCVFIVSCKALWGGALCHAFLAYFLFQFLLCACCVCSNSSPTNALLPLAGIDEVSVTFVSGNRVIHMHQVGYWCVCSSLHQRALDHAVQAASPCRCLLQEFLLPVELPHTAQLCLWLWISGGCTLALSPQRVGARLAT